MQKEILTIRNLKTSFHTQDGTARAIDGLDFSVNHREIVGVVGESGCGKSVTALSIMRLVPNPPGEIESGEIYFEGEDLLRLSENEMRKIRGNKISMVFQEPMVYLNPVLTVGDQISEPIRLHQGLSRTQALDRVIELLRSVEIPSPEERIRNYPHQMSGGMRQRTMIAMAISCHPKLLIADEPTTALDVTIQLQILNVMRKLRDDLGTTIILITHNLGIVAEMVDKVIVMYAGKVVEDSPVKDLFEKPYHPYTTGLLKSIPRLDQKRRRLHIIPGNVPNILNLPDGCVFNDRCEQRLKRCLSEHPPLFEIGAQRFCRCWLYS
ncbi:MAG: ABC transporter ATP-binding protein [Deltaproteobacteria bacterium]|nr:ABC transporter ATP-binding protein [Deltaproteobacteria bacterium]